MACPLPPRPHSGPGSPLQPQAPRCELCGEDAPTPVHGLYGLICEPCAQRAARLDPGARP